MMPICDLLARNLGKPNGHLCPVSTPFDEELALNTNSYFIRRSEGGGRACGLIGEPSCEEIEKMANYHQRNITVLSEKRNEYLKKINDIPSSCFITPEELARHFNIHATKK